MGRVLDRILDEPTVWTEATDLPDNGTVKISKACRSEIEQTLDLLRANPLPMIALKPDDFHLPACRSMMASVRETLDTGIGFAILDRLPIETMTKDEAKSLYWLLLSMVGRCVGQSWAGDMMFDVTDSGNSAGPGTGVRGAQTANRQRYHTDNSYNLSPEYVSLLCLEIAKEGGVSGIISFYTVHNILLEEYSDLLPRFYEPFPFERHRQHAPNDALINHKPLFEYDNETLKVCLGVSRIRAGYDLLGEEMDSRTSAALDALDEVLERPGMGKSFTFAPGQIQILNNRKIAHRRTSYTDWPEPERKRHLARLWLRNNGRRFYMG